MFNSYAKLPEAFQAVQVPLGHQGMIGEFFTNQ